LLGILTTVVGSLLVLVVADGLVQLVVVSVILGFGIHALFPAIDAYILTALPDATRASAYAVFSSVWMLSQSAGSSVVGTLIEAGYSYETVFTGGALMIAATVLVVAVLEHSGRLPS